jgi:glycosyltransferase involved in cell wall biosynthesis
VADEPRALAQATRRLCDEPALAERLRRNARELVAQEHSWEAVAPRFVRIVERAEGAVA